MTIERFVLIDAGGAYVNTIECDTSLVGTDAEYHPPEGLTMMAEADYSPPPPAPPSAAELKAYAAAKRYGIEVGGIVSPTFGPLDTDRDTRAIISQTVQSIDLGLVTEPVRFKAGGTLVSLDRAAFVAISAEIVAHVQATFEREDQIDSAIDAGTVTSFAEVDANF